METNKSLELRMYGLVNYQLTGIQQGIQFGHAVVEYGLHNFSDKDYQDWAKNWKTFIILNGGTTNENPDDKFYGTLQQHRDEFFKNNVKYAIFKEPDLNNTLTAIVFLVDERVFKRNPKFEGDTYYPDFYDYLKEKYNVSPQINVEKELYTLESSYPKDYTEWVELIGGTRNVFLRSYLKSLKLA